MTTAAQDRITRGATTAAQRGANRGEARRVTRLLVSFASGQRRSFVMAVVMLAAEQATAILEPYPLAYAIDFLRGDRPALRIPGLSPSVLTVDISTILVLTLGILVLAMINGATDSMSEIYLAKGGRTLGFNIRVALYSHLQRLSLAFHNKSRTGDMLTRVTSDVTVVEDFVTDSVSDLVGSILYLPGALIFLLTQSWQVTVMAVILVPLLSIVSNFFSKRIKNASKRQRAREGDLASAAQEMLTSIRVIQTYGRGGFEQQRFADQSNKAMRAALDSAGLEAWFGWVVKTLEAATIATVVWLGYILIERQTLTVGQLVLFTLVIQGMFKPTRRIIKEWGTIGKIFASVERIADLLDRQPSVVDIRDAVPAPPFKGLLEFRHVSFAYQMDPVDQAGAANNIRLALDDVTFSARPGEVIALVGPSGAGKSTVLQLIPRLYDPHAGSILIDGHDIRTFTMSSLREQLSMVLQETVLFSGTVAYNIAYGADNVTRDDIVNAARQANAHEFIKKMPEGYDTELSERAANLSGGQRQRIAIARALVRNSPILLLDEPTTGLDAQSTDLVLQALQRLMKGKTTIIISHDLNLVRPADEILVIASGRIEERGRHDELLRREGLYASLHARQFGATEAAPAVAQREPEAEGDGLDMSPQVFQTMLLDALPMPVERRVFEHTMGHGRSFHAPDRPPDSPRPPSPQRPRRRSE
jgi:ABC-type multidrug transport system fused ATPase/permease subunit